MFRGLLLAEQSTPTISMSKVIAYELEILGSHGMQAHRYDALFAMIEAGKVAPAELIGRTITLAQSIDALVKMDKFEGAGVTVVTEF
jgi:alcohol dehydrogenase